jgi:hypothetical protein
MLIANEINIFSFQKEYINKQIIVNTNKINFENLKLKILLLNMYKKIYMQKKIITCIDTLDIISFLLKNVTIIKIRDIGETNFKFNFIF